MLAPLAVLAPVPARCVTLLDCGVCLECGACPLDFTIKFAKRCASNLAGANTHVVVAAAFAIFRQKVNNGAYNIRKSDHEHQDLHYIKTESDASTTPHISDMGMKYRLQYTRMFAELFSNDGEVARGDETAEEVAGGALGPAAVRR